MLFHPNLLLVLKLLFVFSVDWSQERVPQIFHTEPQLAISSSSGWVSCDKTLYYRAHLGPGALQVLLKCWGFRCVTHYLPNLPILTVLNNVLEWYRSVHRSVNLHHCDGLSPDGLHQLHGVPLPMQWQWSLPAQWSTPSWYTSTWRFTLPCHLTNQPHFNGQPQHSQTLSNCLYFLLRRALNTRVSRVLKLQYGVCMSDDARQELWWCLEVQDQNYKTKICEEHWLVKRNFVSWFGVSGA